MLIYSDLICFEELAIPRSMAFRWAQVRTRAPRGSRAGRVHHHAKGAGGDAAQTLRGRSLGEALPFSTLAYHD